jgi:hypothetical protein
MWTAVNLSTTLLWDECLWWVVATWQDDAESAPVVLHRSGRAPLRGADDPRGILAVVLQALEAELQPQRA